jgi:hypothetical protein
MKIPTTFPGMADAPFTRIIVVSADRGRGSAVMLHFGEKRAHDATRWEARSERSGQDSNLRPAA